MRRAGRGRERERRLCGSRGSLVLGALAFLLAFAGCGEKTSTPPPSPNPPDYPVESVSLEDDLGFVVSASADSFEGELMVPLGDTLGLLIRALDHGGSSFDPLEAGVETQIELRDSNIADGLVDTLSSENAPSARLRLRGLFADTTSLRMRLASPDQTIFVSAWIPVRVGALGDSVGGLSLSQTLGGGDLYSDSPYRRLPLFLEAGKYHAVTVSFWGPDGHLISPARLGTGARLDLVPKPADILNVSPRAGEQFGFDLRADGPGIGRLGFRLVRGNRILYRSPGAVLEVVRVPAADWAPLDPRNGPDRPVLDLLVHDGRLLVAGEFHNIGSTPAEGIAAWDGSSWSAFGAGLEGVVQLFAEDSLLVARSWVFGFRRWDGSAWVPFAPLYPGVVEAAALYDGHIVVTGRGLGVLVWRGGDWVQIGDPAFAGPGFWGSDLCVHEGALYLGGVVPGIGPVEVAHVWRLEGNSWVSLFSASGEFCSFHYLASLGSDLLMAYGCGDTPQYGLLDSGGFQPRGDLSFSSAARLEGRFVSTDGSIVYLEEESGLRTIGTIDRPKRIDEIVTFQGALIACGDFTAVNGRDVSFVARWKR